MSQKRVRYQQKKRAAEIKHRKRLKDRLGRPVKIEMFIDESGNSGLELFRGDDYFICCGMLVRENAFKDVSLDGIRAKVQADIHGSALGLSKIEVIAEDLLAIFKAVKPMFVASFVDKKYFCAMKLWDCIFDAAHNPGVSGIHITSAPLRFIGMVKFCHVVPEDMLKRFWVIYQTKNYPEFVVLCDLLRPIFANSDLDARSKSLIEDAFVGAKMKPELVISDGAIKEDSPNVTAITMMCHELNNQMKNSNLVLTKIFHDQQDQFKENLEYMFNAIRQVRIMWGMRSIMPQYEKALAIEGSLIVSECSSDQLDLADIACYLMKKMKDTEIKGKSGELAEFIWSKTMPLMMNEWGLNSKAKGFYDEIMSKPFTDEMKERAMVFYKKIDDARADRLRTGEVEWG